MCPMSRQMCLRPDACAAARKRARRTLFDGVDGEGGGHVGGHGEPLKGRHGHGGGGGALGRREQTEQTQTRIRCRVEHWGHQRVQARELVLPGGRVE
eukprot:6058755-Pleurochrysis_carterae.AAC.3